MARPSSFTEERRTEIERALAVGAPLSVAAAAAGVSPRTVSRWLEDGRIARRSLSAVPDAGTPATLPEDEHAIQQQLLGTVLQAAEHDWRAATWLLAKRWPERFGPR